MAGKKKKKNKSRGNSNSRPNSPPRAPRTADPAPASSSDDGTTAEQKMIAELEAQVQARNSPGGSPASAIASAIASPADAATGAPTPPPEPPAPDPWPKVSAESRDAWLAEFDALNDTGTESLEGGKIVEVLLRAGVPNETLRVIWDLADEDQDGKMSADEYVIAMYLT